MAGGKEKEKRNRKKRLGGKIIKRNKEWEK